jgi:hypothetical protein
MSKGIGGTVLLMAAIHLHSAHEMNTAPGWSDPGDAITVQPQTEERHRAGRAGPGAGRRDRKALHSQAIWSSGTLTVVC